MTQKHLNLTFLFVYIYVALKDMYFALTQFAFYSTPCLYKNVTRSITSHNGTVISYSLACPVFLLHFQEIH